MKNYAKNKNLRQVTVDGMISLTQFENGLHSADFACSEEVNIDSYTARCKMQVMRDGNVYITELPKRKRNNALFREDNCSLTLGYDGQYYFSFALPKEKIQELPSELVRQASLIAHEVMIDIIGNY